MIKTPVVVRYKIFEGQSPAALLVQKASLYMCKIWIYAQGKTVNAKSIIGTMNLNLSEGEALTVITEGEDEEKAAEGIKTFFESGRKIAERRKSHRTT